MPALDFSDLLEEQTPTTGPLTFDDILAPAAPAVPPAPVPGPLTFTDLVPAGEDPAITGGAQITATKSPLDHLRAGEFGDALKDTYESLRRQVSGLLGPTEAERIENSVQWGTDEQGNPKFEYKPLGDRFSREQGLMTPYLKIEPMKKNPEDSLAKAAGKAVFNNVAGLQGGLLSPGGIATAAVGAGSQGLGRVLSGGFAVDMGKHFLDSAKQAMEAVDPQDKIEGWISAISSLGFAGLAGAHAAGPTGRMAVGLRPDAGGRVLDTAGKPVPRETIPPEQIAALESVAPATAGAISAVPTAPEPGNPALGPAAAPLRPAAEVLGFTPEADLANLGATTGDVTSDFGILERQPATSTSLDPNLYPPAHKPIADLKLSKEVPNFKSNADPETGVVEGQQLEGKYDHLAGGNIIVWERASGEREVVSGRHRFDLARRTGEPTISQQTVKESEGWTPQRVARLDAEINIKDGQGTVTDYANFFRNSEGTRADAENSGLLSRAKGRAGYTIGKLASDDLFSLFAQERIPESHALAIVDAAQADPALQRDGARYSLSNPKATPAEVANRVKAASLVDRSKADLAQGEFWDSGDSVMAAMDKAANTAIKFQAERRDNVRTLQAALSKSDELKLTPAEAKRFGVHDPNSVLAIRQALQRERAELEAWENWHLDPEKTKAVLEKSGTGKQLGAQPTPQPKPEQPAGRRVAKIALGDSNGKRIAEGELGAEHRSLIEAPGTMEKLLEAGEDPFSAQHGFLDADGNWMSRTEAWDVAKQAGQLDPDFVAREEARAEERGTPPELHSQYLKTEPGDAFFDQLGLETPKPEEPPPAERPKASDVTETALPESVVERPEGATNVFKLKTGKSTGTVVEYPDRYELKDLISLEQGRGGGTAVIEALKARGKPIELTAGQRTTDAPLPVLRSFYSNRGFYEVEGSPGKFRWDPPTAELIKGEFPEVKSPETPENPQKLEPETLTTKDGRKYRLAVEESKYREGTKEEPGLQVSALDEAGNEVGYVIAKIEPDGSATAKMANVDKKWQRQGVYSELVNKLEARGHKVTPDSSQSPDAQAFWANRRARPLPQAAGASNIRELQAQQHTFAADVYAGLAKAEGKPPTRETWEGNFLRHYPELEGDTVAIDRAWTIAQEAAQMFKDARGRKPMPAIIEELDGAIRSEGVTGIKNRQADIVRRERGLPAAFQPARRAWGRVWDEAMRTIDDNPQAQDALVQRLRDDPMAIVDDKETAMLLHRQIDLETRYDRAVQDVNRAFDGRDENARTEALDRARTYETALIEILDLNKQVGTAQGRSLAARKMMGRRDYTLERMIAEERSAKGGEDLTPAEREKVTKDFDDITRTQSELDAREIQLDEEAATKQADDSIADLKKEAAADPDHEPAVVSLAERVRQRLQKAEDEAVKRLRAKLNIQLGSIPDVTIVSDLAIIGASKIAKGVLKFSEFSAAMVKDFGEQVTPYLQKAWDEANRKVDQAVAAAAPRQKREVGAAVRNVDPEKVRERAAATMEKRMKDGGKLADLQALVRKVALSFVRGGLTEREALVDAVHNIVQGVVSDATRRQTMDLMSGYGSFAKLDPETAKVQLRDINGQLQQLSKLEDLRKGKPLLKTGVERRTQSDTERRLIAEVNEAKRKYGVVTTDPEKQLKGALDAIKTRLRNQIKDIADQLESGKRPVAKTKVQYDLAAEQLKAVRDRMQQTLADIEGKPEMTDADRLKIAMRSTEESLAEYERRIRERDFGPQREANRTPPSTQLEALKARRDALKAEFEELRAADEGWREQQEFDSLMRQADQLEQRLSSGDIAPRRPGEKPPATDIVSQARDRVNALREVMRQRRAATPEARQAKLDSARKAVERSIADYDMRLKTGAIDPVTKAKSADSPELQRLRAERDAMRQLVTDLRNAAKPKLTPEEISLRALKSRLTRQTADLTDRISRGDFDPRPPRRVDISADPEAIRLKAANDQVKAEFENRKRLHERENRTAWEKARDTAFEALNLPRAVLSSFDLSATLRQGGFLALGNPVRAARALSTSVKAMFSRDSFAQTQAQIKSRPNAPLYKQSGLFLAETGEVALTSMEEARMSELADRIPFVRGSNRAYVAFLNRMRADTFDSLLGSLSDGRTPTLREMRAIAEYINISSGRGNLGRHAQAAQTLATVFFSPRLLTSRFQLLAGVGSGFRFGGGSLRTRALIAKEYAKTLTGLGVIYALGQLGGADVGTDPRSADFGKLKFGNTRVDFLMGLAQVTTLMSRLGTGELVRSDKRVVPARLVETTGNFLRSKFSPILGAAFDARDIYVGHKPAPGHAETFGELGLRLSAPLYFQDVLKIMEDNGVPRGIALSLLSLFGAGVQVYDDKRSNGKN
jgi:hypothetical protein